MSKILKSLQFVTQSVSPSTPAAGTGALFASGSGSGASIYFENADGTIYDLAATNGYIVTRSYTGSTTGTDVTYTWNKNDIPGLKYLEICCVGGGGGGGSGRCNSANAQQTMTGGGGGAIVYQWIEAARLDASYTITVGKGGTPGAPRTATGAALAGNPGGNGGDTSFGNLVIAKGGQGGLHASHASGGQANACTPSRGPWTIQGCSSGNATGQANQTTNSGNIFDPDGEPTLFQTTPTFQAYTAFGNGAGAGGTGGGFGTIAPPIFSGRSGSGVDSTVITGLNLGIGYFGGGGGLSSSLNNFRDGGNGSNGVDNVVTSLLPLSGSSGLYGLGTGGGGGAPARVFPGSGGNAGFYGAGGGGGGQLIGNGSALIPSSSGAGGSGSSGLCLLIEYY